MKLCYRYFFVRFYSCYGFYVYLYHGQWLEIKFVFWGFGEFERLLTTHVVNKNSENEFYKEIDKCIKELEGIFTIWKLICELTERNFLYIYFSTANFTYQLELDGFDPNAIKIVKLIKSILVLMQSRSH